MSALPDFRGLVGLTLRHPATAARVLIGLGLPSQALWSALALAAALQAILFTLSTMLFPVPFVVPAILSAPLSVFGLIFAALVLSVYGLLWAGRMLGGQGDLAGILVLCVWAQLLRAGLQAFGIFLSLTLPGLTPLLSLAALALGLYIFVNFINEAHGLDSPMRAFGVLAGAFVIMALGLSILLSVIGVSFEESLTNV